MREELLNELMVISEEEKKYRAGQGMVERQLYARESIGEIDRELLLKRGRLITVRPHSRFVDFPEHRHNYVEIMYVVQGSITHIIEGKELTLSAGQSMRISASILSRCRSFLRCLFPCCTRKMCLRNLSPALSDRKIRYRTTCCSA